jgi:transcriptional regulator of acetoin/glycerol metabolism
LLDAVTAAAPASAAIPVTAPAPDLETLLVVLRSHGGNVSRAAAALGISRQKAYRLMEAAPRGVASDDAADPPSVPT